MPLRVIDGTPTAISKFIREEEERRKKKLCPKCGSEMTLIRFWNMAGTTLVPVRWYCKCGHEDKVEGEK